MMTFINTAQISTDPDPGRQRHIQTRTCRRTAGEIKRHTQTQTKTKRHIQTHTCRHAAAEIQRGDRDLDLKLNQTKNEGKR